MKPPRTGTPRDHDEAEGEGFEPPDRVDPVNSFQGCRNQPDSATPPQQTGCSSDATRVALMRALASAEHPRIRLDGRFAFRRQLVLQPADDHPLRSAHVRILPAHPDLVSRDG